MNTTANNYLPTFFALIVVALALALVGCNEENPPSPEPGAQDSGANATDEGKRERNIEYGLPMWNTRGMSRECIADGSDPDPPPLLIDEWVRNTDGVVFGEVLRVEPVLDRFFRPDTGALDTSGDCLDPEWQQAVYADLVIRPELAAGAAVGLDEVRLRLTASSMIRWMVWLTYHDGIMQPRGIEEGRIHPAFGPGMMIGARLHDLGMDYPEPVFSTLGTSLFTFDHDERMELQYSSDDIRNSEHCDLRFEVYDYQREVDDVRPGLSFSEFRELLSELSPDAFGIGSPHPPEARRASAGDNTLLVLDPSERAAREGYAELYKLLTSSSCRPPGWERFPPRDPDEFEEEENPDDE